MEYATAAQKNKLLSLGVQFSSNISKQEASGLIDAALKGRMPETPRQSYGNSWSKSTKKSDTNFYVSYAKDLVIAMYQFNAEKIKDLTLDEVMSAAIIAIDNCKKHFDGQEN